MKPVVFLDAAMAEFEAAAEYYEQRVPGLGVEFQKAVAVAVHKIQDSPLRWMPYSKRNRRLLLHRFPYLVIFSELEDKILIIAVAHGKRRPGYWHGRI